MAGDLAYCHVCVCTAVPCPPHAGRHNRPIFDFCVDAKRLHGSSPRQWWWEQPMDLDGARGPADAGPAVVSDDEGSVDDMDFGE